ncbi:hypothetical protein KY363_01035 [Candidatus Woesearchaeota archaeon]|nr:hypothetical protein [Candidatus Woesearchaeota archaeon]
MKEVSLQDIEKLAEGLAAKGSDWHFHLLTPGCNLNAGKNVHAVVVEDMTSRETYVAYSSDDQTALGSRLVVLRNRSRKPAASVMDPEHEVMEAIIEKAKEMTKAGKPWHCHRLCPGCKFNRHHGQWVVLFEDEGTGEMINALFDSEPRHGVDCLEDLYYKGKGSAPPKGL